jgi:RNA polymerase sigma-70 factor (ECF subfamily)
MTRDDFNDFVRQYYRKLYGYAFRILRNQEEAEDAVQEIFIKLWNMEEKLDNYSSISALATTIMKNYCIDQLRKKKNTNCIDDVTGEYKNFSSPSPHEQLEIRESYEIVNTIIVNMPDGYSELVRKRDIEGLSYEEIAETTGLNINTLRVTISRARRFIRDEFKKYQYEHKGIEPVARKVL